MHFNLCDVLIMHKDAQKAHTSEFVLVRVSGLQLLSSLSHTHTYTIHANIFSDLQTVLFMKTISKFPVRSSIYKQFGTF